MLDELREATLFRQYILILSIIIITIFTSSCAQKDNETNKIDLTISAAISLSEVLTELKTLYESENDMVNITYNFGGSGTLSQQIQQGAPVDIFISANEQWMDRLQKEQLIVEHTLTTVAMNELVLIGKFDVKNEQTIEQYLTQRDAIIAIGHPDTVPAGKYGKQTLVALNLYDKLKNELILAKDVRQVLTYVESGNADYGFVYKSDALTSKTSDILVTIDEHLHEPIIYPAALLTNAPNEEAANEFLLFLMSEDAKRVFETHGFKKFQ